MSNQSMYRSLSEADPQIAAAIDNETRRQHEGLELIASENFVSEAVLEAAGSVFTNTYAEGYPGKRYYGGCEFTDVVEDLARTRAKQLFNAEHGGVGSGDRQHAATGRQGAGDEPEPWRSPHPRSSPEFFRQDLQDRPVRRNQRDGND